MAEMVCPECGRTTELVAIRRSAEEFCGHCDFPLFWAPSNIPATVPGSGVDASLRRLPGAGGRQRVGSKVCPSCGELNPLGEVHCLRCRSDLDPAPAPPPAPAPAPQLVVPPMSPPIEAREPWWRWLLIATAVVVAVALVSLLIWG